MEAYLQTLLSEIGYSSDKVSTAITVAEGLEKKEAAKYKNYVTTLPKPQQRIQGLPSLPPSLQKKACKCCKLARYNVSQEPNHGATERT